MQHSINTLFSRQSAYLVVLCSRATRLRDLQRLQLSCKLAPFRFKDLMMMLQREQRREGLTSDLFPIKFLLPKKFRPFFRVVRFVPHPKQRRLRFDKPPSQLLPKNHHHAQHHEKKRMHARTTERESKDKVTDMIAPSLLLHGDRDSRAAIEREILFALRAGHASELVP